MPEPISTPAPVHILVIEDDVLTRAALADEFRELGLTVIEARDADEAASYLDAGGHVDLIFSDICMPGSMNGLEFASLVRAQHPRLPVILTSGNVGLPSTDEFGPFLPKPYDMDRAVSLVFETLKLPRPGRGG